MKTIKIQVKDIKPNPFKKFINKGELNEDNILKLIESISHGTLPEVFTIRNSNGENQLCFGHHRLEAIKRVNGKSYEVLCSVVDRTDEQMIVDMARENLSQRSDDFKEELGTVRYVKKYLTDKSVSVMEQDTSYRKGVKGFIKGGKNLSEGIGARQIAIFLSKDGKMISHSKVANILKIDRDVSPDLVSRAETSKNQWDLKKGTVSPSILSEVSVIKDYKLQEKIVEEAKDKEIGHKEVRKIVQAISIASDDLKEKIKKDEISISDVAIENLKESIKEKIEQQKEKDKGKIVVTHYTKFQRDAGNRVGDTNDRILQTCLFLNGLEKSGVLYKLDWNTMLKIIQTGTSQGRNYSKFMDKIIERMQ